MLLLALLSARPSGADGDATAGPAAPDGLLPVPDYGGDPWSRSHLIGDWGDTRTELATHGVQIEVDWTQYVQGVVDGGVDRTTRYGGHLDYLVGRAPRS
jgi:hypothetical protein